MPTAIITGATRGIGKAIALRLLNEGFDLAICAKNEAALNKLKAQWTQDFKGSTILTAAFDISDTSALRSFALQVLNTFSSVDILVNNAGVFMPGNIMDEPEGQLEQLLQVNLMSAYHLSRAIIPVMQKQQYIQYLLHSRSESLPRWRGL
jgi:NAD(P)-dependent dehydrogenase (short-subunit alcohol dehydrogenase family)